MRAVFLPSFLPSFFSFFLLRPTKRLLIARPTGWKGAQIFTCIAWMRVSAWVYTAPSEADYPANSENLSYSSWTKPRRWRPPTPTAVGSPNRNESVKAEGRFRVCQAPSTARLTLSHRASRGPRRVPHPLHLVYPSIFLQSRPNFLRVLLRSRNSEWEAHWCAKEAVILRATFAKSSPPSLKRFFCRAAAFQFHCLAAKFWSSTSVNTQRWVLPD